MKRLFAEFFGTFWLVFGGCGSALYAAGIPELGIGFAGVALAFGLTVLTMAYAVGHISGGHFNPAVSVGLWVGGKFKTKDLAPYIISQLIGGIAAAGALYFIASGKEGFAIDPNSAGAFAANGYGTLSPNGYSMEAAFATELLLTFFFLLIILGATDKFANTEFCGIVIGFALTLIHLISIPITNTSVNPARSTSQALFAGGEYIPQLWLFWLAPILGAILAGFAYKFLLKKNEEE